MHSCISHTFSTRQKQCSTLDRLGVILHSCSSFVFGVKSQIHFYLETPLYIKNDKGGFVLYKAENTKIDINRFSAEAYPQLYIPEEVKETAFKELQSRLKEKLIKRVHSGDLKSIKSALSEIVQEAMQEPLGDNLQTLPETLDIVYQE